MPRAEQPDRVPEIAEALDDAVALDLHRRALGREIFVDRPFDRPLTNPPPGTERSGRLACGEDPDRVEPVPADHLVEDSHAPAAALAEIGSEREAGDGGEGHVPGQCRTRRPHRAPLELAPADGSAKPAVRSDHHARTGLARRGPAHRGHRDEGARPVSGDHLRNRGPDPHRLRLATARARVGPLGLRPARRPPRGGRVRRAEHPPPTGSLRGWPAHRGAARTPGRGSRAHG